MEKEHYLIHGQASQDLIYWTKAHLKDTHGPVRLAGKQTISRPNNVWPDMWKHMSDAPKRKAKQKWAMEKPKLDIARQIRGIFFIEPGDEEFKLTMKSARRKLEIPMPAAMPCETAVNCRGETRRSIGKHKTKHACVVEGDESTRIRLEGVPSRHPEDHIAARGEFMEPLQFGAQSNSNASSNENAGCKGSSEQRMGKNLRKYRHDSWQKSETKKKWSMKQGMKGRKVHSASLSDLCHLKNLELEP